MHRDKTAVENEMHDHTGNNQNSNKKFQTNFEATPGKHSTDSLQNTAVLEHYA
jgi:hypothetical protein